MRRRRLSQLIAQASDEEQRLESAMIVKRGHDGFEIVVNGRAVPRKAVVDNEFVLNRDGDGVGEEVLVLTCPYADMPVIVGRSNWLLNQGGTEYSG